MYDYYSSQMLLVGTVLDNHYRIVHYLASGGFGNTYVAIDTHVNCYVAVKEFFMRGINHRADNHLTVVVSNAANQEGFNAQLESFRSEAQRIIGINHEHIVHVKDLFDANGTSYYVMDLIEGESLKDRLAQCLLTEHEVRDIARQLLDALDAVHKAGFYHLNVMPCNIMIDKNGHCTLIGFGASKQISTQERMSMYASGIALTSGYAPLEQEGLHTRCIGPWTDYYAVGATLYNLLTGQVPPEINSDDTADDSRMFDYPNGVTHTMQHAISCMMNPSPSKRPQNIEQMKAVLAGTPIRNSRESRADETVVSSGTWEGGNNPPLIEGSWPKDGSMGVSVRTSIESQEAQIGSNENAGQNGGSTHTVGYKLTFVKIKWVVLAFLAVYLPFLVFILIRSSENSAPSVSSLSQDNTTKMDNKADVESFEKESLNGTTATVEEVKEEPFIDPNIDRIYIVGGVPFKMIAVEGYTFTMGATTEQVNPAYDEKPAHKVTLSSFSIGETEVTQELWKVVMGSNPSYFKGDNNPVESVNWNDCQLFIQELNTATNDQRPKGREFRLPTEAEWEFAARGGIINNHTQYAGSNTLSSVAWYEGNSEGMTHPVAQKEPNELRLFDMNGNVWEWCYDWYDVNYYSLSPATNPCNKDKGSRRVARGGSWGSSTSVSFRGSLPPSHQGNILGLRLAL